MLEWGGVDGIYSTRALRRANRRHYIATWAERQRNKRLRKMAVVLIAACVSTFVLLPFIVC
jgi:hypothetical protein